MGKHDHPGNLRELCRAELAEALGYDLEAYLGPPVWGQLLKEVKALVKDRDDLRTLRRILKDR